MQENSLIPIGAKAVRVFAARLARKCFLEHCCSDEHPILSIERDLVEMARSKMMEQLLSIYRHGTLGSAQPAIIKMILKMARSRIASHVEDEEIQETIMQSVQSEIEVLFPSLH